MIVLVSDPLAGGQAWAAACGFPNVEITAGRVDREPQLCQALAEVQDYFLRLALPFEPELLIRWAKNQPMDNAGAAPSHGSFNSRTGEMILYDSVAARPWGLTWSPETAATFLRHEVVHMAIVRILGREAARLRREWHEFIAYAVQIDLMDIELRSRILGRYATIEPASDLPQINRFTFEAMAPDEFAVLAFVTYRAHGGPHLVRRLLTFEVEPPPIVEIFPPPTPSQ